MYMYKISSNLTKLTNDLYLRSQQVLAIFFCYRAGMSRQHISKWTPYLPIFGGVECVVGWRWKNRHSISATDIIEMTSKWFICLMKCIFRDWFSMRQLDWNYSDNKPQQRIERMTRYGTIICSKITFWLWRKFRRITRQALLEKYLILDYYSN